MGKDKENQGENLLAIPATALAFTIKSTLIGFGVGMQIGILRYFPRNSKYVRYAAIGHLATNFGLLALVDHFISLDKALSKDYYHKKTDENLTQMSVVRGNFKASMRGNPIQNMWLGGQNLSYIANNLPEAPDDNQAKE